MLASSGPGRLPSSLPSDQHLFDNHESFIVSFCAATQSSPVAFHPNASWGARSSAGTYTMSRDPYHDFASDLKASLSSARSLSQSYQQLVTRSTTHSHASSSSSLHTPGEIQSAYDRLSDAIEGLRQDVEDVKQSVLVVERSGPERFGVTPEELQSRKAFVAECEAEVKVRSIAQQRFVLQWRVVQSRGSC